ncbi:adhesion G-protein coupled receptor G7 [Discoglossus pictus]
MKEDAEDSHGGLVGIRMEFEISLFLTDKNHLVHDPSVNQYPKLKAPSPPSAPPSPPPCNCKNNGTCENGFCICPNEWTGQFCTEANFCNASEVIYIYNNGTQERLTFETILVGRFGYSNEKCDVNTLSPNTPKATRSCLKVDNIPVLQNASFRDCNENLDSLSEKINSSFTEEEITGISISTQLLTSQPEQLNARNISSALDIVYKILNNPQTAEAAVTTVSQLLDANVTEFTSGTDNVTENAERLTQVMETFSVSENNNASLVQPNVAVLQFPANPGKGVLFTSLRGLDGGNSLLSSRIDVTSATELVVNTSAEVQIFINASERVDMESRAGFVLYQNDNFFRSKTHKAKLNFRKRIISGNFGSGSVKNLNLGFNVDFIMNPQYDSSVILVDYACVFWDYYTNDWNTTGCSKVINNSDLLRCTCNHTTNFAVLMSFRHNITYAQPLDIVSTVGCSLSIIGLVTTIIFQIVISKKQPIKLGLLSLCVSMLVFNIIFMAGLENQDAEKQNGTSPDPNNILLFKDLVELPENPACTAVTALLHYFLLATFVWSAINAAQMYVLLVQIKPSLPSYFLRSATLIGWGLPAIIVAITLGATYRVNSPLEYRQEEFCWLASLDEDGEFDIKKPMLWAFLLPVGIIMTINICIFVGVAVRLIWRKDKQLQSTRRTSFLKKTISILSVAVLLGVTWIFGYLMLINDDRTGLVFRFIFCICNSTQGLQIFLLYTLRSPIFLKKMLELFKSCKIYIHSEKYTLTRLGIRRTQRHHEKFRKLDSDNQSILSKESSQ